MVEGNFHKDAVLLSELIPTRLHLETVMKYFSDVCKLLVWIFYIIDEAEQ